MRLVGWDKVAVVEWEGRIRIGGVCNAFDFYFYFFGLICLQETELRHYFRGGTYREEDWNLACLELQGGGWWRLEGMCLQWRRVATCCG